MKQCKKCKGTEFYPRGDCKTCKKARNLKWRNANPDWNKKYYSDNKDKIDEKNRKWIEENKDRHQELLKQWRDNNRPRIAELSKKRFSENRELMLAQDKKRYYRNVEVVKKRQRDRYKNPDFCEKMKQYQSNYKRTNKHKVVMWEANRRSMLLKATPPWADNDLIFQIYAKSAKLTEETGIQHHVDHTIPLINKKVCGLHVHYNLNVITAKDNVKKGNSFLND